MTLLWIVPFAIASIGSANRGGNDRDRNERAFDEIYQLTFRCDLNGDLNEQTFPCSVPIGLPTEFGPSANFRISGKLFVDTDNARSRVTLEGRGAPPALPITVWMENILDGVTENEILDPAYIYPASPLCATTAAFTNGRDPYGEPNIVRVDKRGRFSFSVNLDYNPLMPNQVPLNNGPSFITQQEFPDEIGGISGLQQNLYKESGRYTMIAREFLREFNEDGSMVIDPNTGGSKVIRSPEPGRFLNIVAHMDFLTHGAASALNPGMNPTTESGDHYRLAFARFDEMVQQRGGDDDDEN